MDAGQDAAETAGRLRHDLGKYIRLSAPETLETDTEDLRARLAADVLGTRSGVGGALSAEAIFAAWLGEGGHALREQPELATAIDRISEDVAELGGLCVRMAGLSRSELERADALTRRIAEECRVLAASARKGPR